MRDCTTHRLTPTVTTTKKRAKTITKAVVHINGRQVKTVKSPKRGLAIPLTLTDDSAANVKVTVTTAKKIKKTMKSGKKKTVIKKTVRTVSANYLACS